ncbi:FAD-dependent oxidoreductase [Rhodococcus sp. D2-41]|uniref:Hydroxysqualene dehydroxylase HpnE n=1 Tax=Speluncibacter jeojiensis TaxID=2710754 RepID=A0A9X4RDL9_9ACTN|nr:hydroxysqualene dehydroxylase HpnE [Rhodococcus sp. D2-41]MDG3010554.1 FAD-dependent oxidoreductase [Rhodococcus sp. D2-41]MDG3014302.1 hydroxysqualene dehydroxylase HpnE [Corynebacteriales bacterium D3-21]
MNGKVVVVIGGGLAGLTAACDLADCGVRVTLVEARGRLGGATFSFHRDGLTVDNGQHVVMRCYSDYLALLDRIGSSDGIAMQNRFRMPVLLPDGTRTTLTRTGGPAPLHLGLGLARYRALSMADRARVLRAATALRRLSPDDPELDGRTFGDWLREHGQTQATSDALWNLISVAALNTDADEASLASAVMVFRTALLDRSDAADIGVPVVSLDELHVRPAARYLRARGGRILTHNAVRHIEPLDRGYVVRLDGADLHADGVVVATPPEPAARICPAQTGLRPDELERLGKNPIMNVHMAFRRKVTDLPFAAVLDSPVQWFFDRTETAGYEGGQYLTISLSAADRWIGTPAPELRGIFERELVRLLPGAADAELEHFFVTRERRGTFRQAPGTAGLRPDAQTPLPGLALAGAWTATGWPDTMEGAVRSGHRAADLVFSDISAQDATPASTHPAGGITS